MEVDKLMCIEVGIVDVHRVIVVVPNRESRFVTIFRIPILSILHVYPLMYSLLDPWPFCHSIVIIEYNSQ